MKTYSMFVTATFLAVVLTACSSSNPTFHLKTEQQQMDEQLAEVWIPYLWLTETNGVETPRLQKVHYVKAGDTALVLSKEPDSSSFSSSGYTLTTTTYYEALMNVTLEAGRTYLIDTDRVNNVRQVVVRDLGKDYTLPQVELISQSDYVYEIQRAKKLGQQTEFTLSDVK